MRTLTMKEEKRLEVIQIVFGQPMDLHRFWDGVITSSSNLTRLRNEATSLRNRQEFQRTQLTELANTDLESWAKESFDKDCLPKRRADWESESWE